ncbi:related to BCP1 - Essential protein involved in nuclear export of cytoskeleton organization protein [Pseudozyma flocculosa]|uniref:Protein BCP1 n=1 Tax=Pseudozyma flocculosa TaxID=84751 RepID=A0A5C3EW93_9BASI|nr:related to BCP1 - Essential protein involved in nuclear export of cytoskeleton organization protein [Pseudozyma flocculosa]
MPAVSAAAVAEAKASKRKAEDDQPNHDGSDYDSDSSDPDFINVDFDFRSPEEIDFQALKRLLQQLFYSHATHLDLGALADHVIKLATTDGVGTTIKIDGDEDQDPYAFVSALELGPSSASTTEAATAATATLTKYLSDVLGKSPAAKDFQDLIKKALSPTSTNPPVTFVLHERMVNMPPQVAPPLYNMLVEELEQARSSKTPAPTRPSHLIFFSRVFSADAFSDDEAMDEDDDDEATGLAGARRRKNKLAKREAKKQGAKKDAARVRAIAQGTGIGGGNSGEEELGLFHPEDKALAKDAADSFEAPLFGRIVALPYDKLADVLAQVQLDLAAP